jgi:tetratricopeptide (TPR) repeat protein
VEEVVEKPSFTHRQLAVSCFNKVWDLLEKENRTANQNEEMANLCHSSFWHWTQVEEHTPTNLSIGYWQLSRVYAVIGQGETALKYAEKCIDVSNSSELKPFYKAYAYEAAARAYKVLNDLDKCKIEIHKAYDFTSQVIVEESKGWLMKDLEEISHSLRLLSKR